jgi:hypothetical protein
MDIKTTLTIPYYSNMNYKFLGLDSSEHCINACHFKNYPDAITYQFNELGFRDCSYEHYKGNEILALGDSFTLGLGVNVEQVWTSVLSKTLNYPVRNFSLNGASNDWMARKITQLLTFFRPKAVIVHYSFSHRRERPLKDWHDDERTECEPNYTNQENLENWEKNYLVFAKLPVPVIHSFISDWDPVGIDYATRGLNVLAPIQKQDLARDGFHYGVKTHQMLAHELSKITNLLGV